tara:strand:+ start:205 stop:438 length:234 start_codon:yes stop_codon:yes gene_type:complete
MKFDGTAITNFIIGSLYLYLFILFIFILYVCWRYYLKKYKHKQRANRINPKVAEEMAKKITEEAAMHRKERREDNNQ